MTTDPASSVPLTLKQMQVTEAALTSAADLTEKVAGRYTHAYQLLAAAQRSVSEAADKLAMELRGGVHDKPGKPGVPETIISTPELLDQANGKAHPQ